MNREVIDKALDVYLKGAEDQDKERLEFFSELWRIQEEEGARIAEVCPYAAPEAEIVEDRYWAGKPVFAEYPVEISADDFAQVCNRIAEHLGEHAGLEEEVIDALAQVSWEDFAHVADLKLAGANPPEFVEQTLQTFDTFDIPTELPASVFMMVPAWALRAFLDAPAAAVMASMKPNTNDERVHDNPLLCPVCGTPATASCVGEVTPTNGGGRTLYCSTCGTNWAFERIRCARCGTQNPNHLHWYHIEGDDAHRMQNCTECYNYMRTVFENESPTMQTSMEVEDVVMVKLDAIAHDDRFQLQEIKD